MKRYRNKLTALGLGVLLLTGGAMSASAYESTSAVNTAKGSTWSSVKTYLADTFNDFELTESSVAPGTIDDGEELLPQARITLDEAIETAQSTGDGALGEVDLEYFHDRLVFNIDIGNTDVKVDALDGRLLGSVIEE